MNAINVADQNKEFCTDRLSKRDEVKDYLVGYIEVIKSARDNFF